MPELAEVEFFRKQWNPGLGQTVVKVTWHPRARIFRGIEVRAFPKTLTGARLEVSSAHGKQLFFSFDRAGLGIHLGMTGHLRCEGPDFSPDRHDHLVLFQQDQALVFRDLRLFGRVLFQPGSGEPEWWTNRAPAVLSNGFTKEGLREFCSRRKGSPLKGVLLMQEKFPGIGNWMADEILWRSRLRPDLKAGKLSEQDVNILWKSTREVSRQALRTVGRDFSDPPDSWLFQHRWKAGGTCPRCGLVLERATVAGRTTCWCSHCQSSSN